MLALISFKKGLGLGYINFSHGRELKIQEIICFHPENILKHLKINFSNAKLRQESKKDLELTSNFRVDSLDFDDQLQNFDQKRK